MANPLDNLKPYKKGQSGNPTGKNAGRKPRAHTILNKILGQIDEPLITEAQWDETYKRLLNLSISELAKVAMDKDAPAYMVYMAATLKEGIKRGHGDLHNSMKTHIFKESATNTSIIVNLGFDLGSKYNEENTSGSEPEEAEETGNNETE